jgi:Fe-S-cluster containining protein
VLRVAHGLRSLRFRCTQCGACCERFRVPLTGADVARLESLTGKVVETFAEFLPPTAVDMTGEPSSFLELPEGRRVPALKHDATGCVFLVNKQCSVHAARPASCALYPFHVELGKRGGIRRLQLLDMTGCNPEWDSQAKQRQVSEQAEAMRRELESHWLTVADFNRAQRRRKQLSKPLLTSQDWWERSLKPVTNEKI